MRFALVSDALLAASTSAFAPLFTRQDVAVSPFVRKCDGDLGRCSLPSTRLQLSLQQHSILSTPVTATVTNAISRGYELANAIDLKYTSMATFSSVQVERNLDIFKNRTLSTFYSKLFVSLSHNCLVVAVDFRFITLCSKGV